MKLNKGVLSLILLLLGMTALAIGISKDNDLFSYAAIALVLTSLVLGRRKPQGKK